MAGAIVLLVGPRVLVLLDDAREVLLDRGAADQPRLPMCAHPLRVDVEARRVVRLQNTSPAQVGERPGPLRVDLGRVLVGAGGQIDLRPRDVQEAVGIAPRKLARLVGDDDVVGRRRHPDSELRRRAQGAKRSQGSHCG